jgi:hypothetical protein
MSQCYFGLSGVYSIVVEEKRVRRRARECVRAEAEASESSHERGADGHDYGEWKLYYPLYCNCVSFSYVYPCYGAVCLCAGYLMSI